MLAQNEISAYKYNLQGVEK